MNLKRFKYYGWCLQTWLHVWWNPLIETIFSWLLIDRPKVIHPRPLSDKGEITGFYRYATLKKLYASMKS